jgi:hypothetical protein
MSSVKLPQLLRHAIFLKMVLERNKSIAVSRKTKS